MIAYASRRLLAAVALFAALGCAKPEEAAPTATATPGASPAASATPGAAAQASPKAAPLAADALPEVVAEVNGYRVPKNDLVQSVVEAQAQLAQMGQQQQTTLPFVRDVLDHMVDQILLEQDGKKAGVVPSDAECEQQLNAMKSRAPSLEAFNQAMAQRGVTEEKLREQIRRKIAVERYLLTRVVVKTPPDEAAIRAFYEQNPDSMKQPERRHLRHILILAAASAPQAAKFEAQKKAETILGRLQKGEDFAKLARENSQDPGSKDLGGDLSWVTRGKTVPTFEAAAFALKQPNDISGVVESPYGYHIIQLLETEADSIRPYAEVREQIAAFLQQKSAREQVAAKVRALRERAEVKIFI